MAKKKESLRVEARISLEKKVELNKLADEYGGISNFIRVAIDKFSKKDSVCLTTSLKNKNGADLHAMSWHLSRIGNSLNQMAYAINKAALSGKVNDSLVKEMIKELMYLNIKIDSIGDNKK